MNIVTRVVRRARREFATWSHKGGYLRRYLFYRVFSQGFKREQDAVGAGIAAYLDRVGSGEELYLLRRNIHMIEKGLTMQPRRDKFAMDYNRQTVESFQAAVARYQGSPWIGSDEYRWIVSVLNEYFDATRSSNTPSIQVLERQYRNALPVSEKQYCQHGPITPCLDASPVAIEELNALAKRRRSVRWFKGCKVDRHIIDRAIEIAQEAPTACNRQPYRFEIFDSKESVQKVVNIPMGTTGYAHQIPGIIVVVGDLSGFFDERDRHLIYIDSSLAVMGLLLGLESQGIASCIINWPDMPDQEKAMRQLLGLKDHERVVMLVAYGYADPNGLAPFSAKADMVTIRAYREL